jgi:hypothetical protein
MNYEKLYVLVMSFMCICCTSLEYNQEPFDRGLGFLILENGEQAIIYKSESMSGELDKLVKREMVFDFLAESQFDLTLSRYFEYDNERFGLPIIQTKANYFKVLVPFSDTTFQFGYVRNDSNVGAIYWKDLLPQKPLFFSEESLGAIYNYPGGSEVDVDLEGASSYVLWPQEVDSNGWMRVKVITPSDQCEERVRALVINGWIEYLNSSGRPNVWYYPRGC